MCYTLRVQNMASKFHELTPSIKWRTTEISPAWLAQLVTNGTYSNCCILRRTPSVLTTGMMDVVRCHQLLRSSGRSRRLASIRTPESRKRRTDSPRTDSSPHTRSIGFVGIDTSSDGLWGSRSDDTRASNSPYYCEICLENRPAEAGFVLSACGHIFCRDCLKAFVTSKITDGQVYPTCFQGIEAEGEADKMEQGVHGCHGGSRTTARPSYLQESKGGESKDGSSLAGSVGEGRKRKSCGVAITKEDIESLLGHDSITRRKYARFLFSRENRNVRECPRCNYLQVGDPKVLEMRCNSCRATFCFEHGGAHAGSTCSEYTVSVAEENSRTMELIGRLTKPCPGCQTPVEKLGGCNQMVCYHCDSSFCWICGAEVDRGTFPVHFQWWNINGCPNQQLQEDIHTGPGGRQFHRVLSAIQIIVIGPVALALTIASSVACVCCLPALNMSPRELFTGCISAWGNFVMLLPILPFICLGFLLMGILYVLYLPFQLVSALQHKYRLRQRRLEAVNAVDGSVLDSNRAIQSVGPIRQSLQGVPFSELSDSSRAWGLSDYTSSTAAAASNVATLGGREGQPSGSGVLDARPPMHPARPRGLSDDTSSAAAAASNVATLGGREYEPSGSGDIDVRQPTTSARPRGLSEDTNSTTVAASNVATLGGREYEPSGSGDIDVRQPTNSARSRGLSDDTNSTTVAASNIATLGGQECEPSSSVDIAARPPVSSHPIPAMSTLAALLGLEGGPSRREDNGTVHFQEQNRQSHPGVTTTFGGIGIGISSSGSGSTLGTASGTGGGGAGRPRVTFPPLIPGPSVPPHMPLQRNGSRVTSRARLTTSASLPVSMGESSGDARSSRESGTGSSGRNSAVTFREFMDMWLGASPLASVSAGAAPPPASASASASASAPTPTPTPTSTPASASASASAPVQTQIRTPGLTSTRIPAFASAPAGVSMPTEGHGGEIDVGGEDGEGNFRLSRLNLQGAARAEVIHSLKYEGQPTEASVPPVAYAK